MCSSVYLNEILGRTLDYESNYGEEVTITPRNYPLKFYNNEVLNHHYAMIGTAHVYENYPLYYEAMNEFGLGICGLNFVGNTYFKDPLEYEGIASYEFILYILSKAKDTSEALKLIENINVLKVSYKNIFPVASLHYIIADKLNSYVIEFMEDKVHIYENKVGILTNNPPFNYQVENLNNYLKCSPKDPINSFSKSLDLKKYSRGMGGIGLPGDLSSQSRFVRLAFARANSKTKDDRIGQYFHVLEYASQTRGLCEVEDGKFEITIYTCAMDLIHLDYYYTTYLNHRINKVSLHHVNLEDSNLVRYPHKNEEDYNFQN